jgi:hypothetical protein
MRKIVLTLAAAAALTGATAANAAITIVDTSGSNIVVGTPDNSTIPNKVGFDTTTNSAGTVSPFFDFSNDQTGSYRFSLITSTKGATVTLEQLLNGGTLVDPITEITGTGNSLTLDTGTLMAGATYRFLYTFGAGDGGGTVSGNASFVQAVPEPATWAMMLVGFGGIGVAMRRRRRGIALAQIA